MPAAVIPAPRIKLETMSAVPVSGNLVILVEDCVAVSNVVDEDGSVVVGSGALVVGVGPTVVLVAVVDVVVEGGMHEP